MDERFYSHGDWSPDLQSMEQICSSGNWGTRSRSSLGPLGAEPDDDPWAEVETTEGCPSQWVQKWVQNSPVSVTWILHVVPTRWLKMDLNILQRGSQSHYAFCTQLWRVWPRRCHDEGGQNTNVFFSDLKPVEKKKPKAQAPDTSTGSDHKAARKQMLFGPCLTATCNILYTAFILNNAMAVGQLASIFT